MWTRLSAVSQVLEFLRFVALNRGSYSTGGPRYAPVSQLASCRAAVGWAVGSRIYRRPHFRAPVLVFGLVAMSGCGRVCVCVCVVDPLRLFGLGGLARRGWPGRVSWPVEAEHVDHPVRGAAVLSVGLGGRR